MRTRSMEEERRGKYTPGVGKFCMETRDIACGAASNSTRTKEIKCIRGSTRTCVSFAERRAGTRTRRSGAC